MRSTNSILEKYRSIYAPQMLSGDAINAWARDLGLVETNIAEYFWTHSKSGQQLSK